MGLVLFLHMQLPFRYRFVRFFQMWGSLKNIRFLFFSSLFSTLTVLLSRSTLSSATCFRSSCFAFLSSSLFVESFAFYLVFPRRSGRGCVFVEVGEVVQTSIIPRLGRFCSLLARRLQTRTHQW